MLHKQSIMGLLMISMIISTASADNKAKVRPLMKQLAEANETLKSGISDDNKSIEDLKQIGSSIRALIQSLFPLIREDLRFTPFFIEDNPTNGASFVIEGMMNKAKEKTAFNRIVQRVEKILSELSRYNS